MSPVLCSESFCVVMIVKIVQIDAFVPKQRPTMSLPLIITHSIIYCACSSYSLRNLRSGLGLCAVVQCEQSKSDTLLPKVGLF